MSRRIFQWFVPALLVALGASQVAGGVWIHAKALLAQALLEYAWQCTRAGEERVRPWPWADTWPVARLSIPRLDATMIVLSGDSGRTLAFGPGHNPGTALPGTAGTAIVSGHRDTHFAALRELTAGDELRIERHDGRLVRYIVDDIAVADARTTSLRAAPDGTTLVLVTCWPFGALQPGGPLRYVVSAGALLPVPTAKPPSRARPFAPAAEGSGSSERAREAKGEPTSRPSQRPRHWPWEAPEQGLVNLRPRSL